jgi:transposase
MKKKKRCRVQMRAQKKYDEELRRQTVEYMKESGKTVSQVSKETDIPVGTLFEWKRKYQGKSLETGKKKAEGETAEKRQLRESERRIRDLEEEVAILKKAMAIFAKNPR